MSVGEVDVDCDGMTRGAVWMPPVSGRNLRRALWSLLAVEVAIVVVLTHPWMAGDSQNYLDLGRGLLEGRYGTTRGGAFVPEAQHPPLYPVFLMVLVGLARLPIAAVVAVQALLFLASVYLVQLLLARHGLTRARHAFLAIVLVCPATLAHSTMIMSEALSIFLLTAIVYVVGAPAAMTHRRAAAAGALTGLAILARPTLVLLPALLGFVLLVLNRGVSWRSVLLWEAAFAALVLGVLTPYAVVNHRQLDTLSFLPPAAAFGYSIYASTWSLDGRVSAISDQAALRADSERINRSIESRLETADKDDYEPGERETKTSRVFLSEAFDRVWRNPGRYAIHVAYNWWRLWNAADYPGAVPAPARLALQMTATAAWALGMLGSGLLILRHRRRVLPSRVPLLVVAAITLYFPVVLAWLESSARYSAPGQLFLQACAALVVAELISLLAARRVRLSQTAGVRGPSSEVLR